MSSCSYWSGRPLATRILLLHDVDAGDALGDGVLHLQAGVHFHEIELVVRIEQELDRAGVDVAHRLGRFHRQVADVAALRFAQLRRGGDFDQFLVAALDRAVALEQVDHVAEGVADDLHLDVLGVDHALFQEHFRLAECFAGFGYHAVVVGNQFGFAVAAADAAPAAAVGGFEHHRIADPGGQRARFLDAPQVVLAARHHRDAGFDHRPACLDLVAHLLDHTGRRADEDDAALGADFRQHRVLGQEAVARMERVAAGGDREVDDVVRVEVADDRVRPDVIGFVRLLDVERVAIGVGIDGHRLDAHFRAGAHDAHGDLAPVGY